MYAMGTLRNKLLAGVCLAATAFVASCNSVDGYGVYHRGPGVGHGPPAHAKAHGYRRKQVCGYEMVYDAGLGVYVVIGVSDCYYHQGYFYRWHGDVWQVTLRIDGDWSAVGHDKLPPGLRRKAKAQAQSKGAHAPPADAHPLGKAEGNAKAK